MWLMGGFWVGPVYSLGRDRYIWLGGARYVSWVGTANSWVGPIAYDAYMWIGVFLA